MVLNCRNVSAFFGMYTLVYGKDGVLKAPGVSSTSSSVWGQKTVALALALTLTSKTTGLGFDALASTPVTHK